MARPSTNGYYSVPIEIQMLKPNDVKCSIKVIYTGDKSIGSNKHYYVCEELTVPDDKKPTRSKRATGKTLGKIEGGKFVPNSYFIQMKKNSSSVEPVKKEEEASGIFNPIKDEIKTVAQTAANMNLSLKNIDLQIKNYGEYAIVLENTKAVLRSLEKYFSDEDARLIYSMSVIHFIEEYTPASYMKDLFDQSVLSNKWPSLSISENSVGDFLKLLGTHPLVCNDYFQDRINQSSGLTAIDGHVVLSCSRQNDLADYGNKYQTLGNKQINMLQAYDVEKGVPLASKIYEGGLLDKVSVQDLLSTYDFPANTCFLIDMGFYSEDDLALYREGGKHFVIPVPEHTSISKAMKENITFDGSFTYEKSDENGILKADTILYREATVEQLEDIYQEKIDADIELKNKKIVDACPENEKPKLLPKRKIKRSQFPEDRVIMFRDSEMHEKMIQEYKEQIGSDQEHTEEKLAEIGPQFGIIVLRTNYTKAEQSASDVYKRYKKRWKIETHYNFVENTIKFCGLKQQDYFAMQGLSFLTVVFGQIKSEYMNSLRKAQKITGRLSIKESLAKAGRVKVSQHKDKTWYANVTVKKTTEMFSAMNVNIGEDLIKLNTQTY